MKQLLVALALLVVTLPGLKPAGAQTPAPANFEALWNPQPEADTVHVECLDPATGQYVEVGSGTGASGRVEFQMTGLSREKRNCKGFAKDVNGSSPRTEVVVAVFPLLSPTNLRVQAAPSSGQ